MMKVTCSVNAVVGCEDNHPSSTYRKKVAPKFKLIDPIDPKKSKTHKKLLNPEINPANKEKSGTGVRMGETNDHTTS